MISRIVSMLFIMLLILPASVLANDFYIINGTYKTQIQAQEIAASNGGWVLNTNFYNQLQPNLYAVVRGPFKTKHEAAKQLSELTKAGRYAGSYVKNAGAITIEIKMGNKKLSPQTLGARHGDRHITRIEEK